MRDKDKDIAELSLNESNELFFKIRVHGAERSPSIIRLVCEMGDIAYSFKGSATGDQDVVRFEVPAMKNTIKNGSLCEARVEVIVDDHYFVPVRFDAEFKEPMAVVAESVTPIMTKKSEPVIQVQASSIPKAQYGSLREKYAKTAPKK